MFRTVSIVAARAGRLLAAAALLAATPAAAQSSAWAWGLQTTNPTPTDGSEAGGNATAVDAVGRVYVGGASVSHATNPSANSRQFGSVGTLGPGTVGFIAQATAGGQWAWQQPVYTTGQNATGATEAEITAVAVGAGRDVYAAGFVQGAAVQVGTTTTALTGTGQAVVVVRLTPAGAVRWVRTFQTTHTSLLLAADPSTGGVVLAGAYHGTPTVGGTTLPTGNSAFNGSPFIARLDSTGQWRGAVAVPGAASVSPDFALAVGPAGQVALVGSQFTGSLVFGATTLTTPAGASRTFFAAQLDAANQWQWAVNGSSPYASSGYGAAYTPTGTLWTTGAGANGTVVGPLTLTVPGATAANSSAGFVGLLAATGQWQLVRVLAPQGDGFAGFIYPVADAAGDVVVLGALRGANGSVQTTLAGQTLTSPTSDNLLFVAGLNAAGQWRYVAAVPPTMEVEGLQPAALTLDAQANLYLTGSLHGTMTFGPTALAGTVGTASLPYYGSDVVLAKLPNAAPLAARFPSVLTPLALYPSPAHHTATLRLPAPTATPETVQIVDALGRPVQQQTLPAHTNEAMLDLTGLAPGLYLVRVGPQTARLVVE